MSYLANSDSGSPARMAADLNCGWSVVHVLAELSLKAAPEPKARRAPRRTAKVPGAETAAALVETAKAL